MRPVLKPSPTNYHTDEYDIMRAHLLQRIGPYCSYCEAPISNDSAVEHKIPKEIGNKLKGRAKSGWDSLGFTNKWRNLLLACQSCNSAKRDKPEIKEPDSYDADEIYKNTLESWVWPDFDETNPSPLIDDIYRLLKVSYQKLSQQDLAKRGVVRLPPHQPQADWVATPYEMAWVLPNENFIGNDEILTGRVKEMLRGLNLNFYNSVSPKFNDRRVLNRTAAYLAAQKALNDLGFVIQTMAILPSSILTPPVILMIQAIRQSIIATGFWTTWFTVFRGALDKPRRGSIWELIPMQERKNILTYLLIYYMPQERDGSKTDLIIAGTDYERLNMNNFR